MQMTRTGSADRAGMTLLEVLGCIAILAVVINLAASVFITSTRLSVLGTSVLDKMCAVEDIRSEFVGAVRASTRVCSSVGKYRSGPDQIVLQMAQPGDQKGVKRYVVFGPIGSDSRLDKLVILEKDGKHTAERFVTYPIDLESIQFRYKRNNPPLHRFTAAMRNVSAAGRETEVSLR